MYFEPMQLLSMWLNERQIQHQSVHTLDAYERDVSAFLQFCEHKNLPLTTLEMADIREYITEKVEQQALSSSSMQRHLSSIRQFMKWAQDGNYLQVNPMHDIQLKRHSRPLPGMIDIETINQILDQVEPEKKNDQQLWRRDKAILELLYSSGLRLAELQQLKLKDIDFTRRLLRITGKGNKRRVVPFGRKAKESLVVWLEVYRLWRGDLQAESAVFISQRGTNLSTRQIENRVKLQAQRAGVNVDLHPHLLRHCFASHLLSNSGDLRAVQEMLGHRNLTTTQIYTHIDFDRLAQVYDQAHPRANKEKS